MDVRYDRKGCLVSQYETKYSNCQRQSKDCILISEKNTRIYLSFRRRNLKRLTDVRTGHGPLNEHLNTIRKNVVEVEPSEHLICQCPAHIMARDGHLGKYNHAYNSIRNLPPKTFKPISVALNAINPNNSWVYATGPMEAKKVVIKTSL